MKEKKTFFLNWKKGNYKKMIKKNCYVKLKKRKKKVGCVNYNIVNTKEGGK